MQHCAVPSMHRVCCECTWYALGTYGEVDLVLCPWHSQGHSSAPCMYWVCTSTYCDQYVLGMQLYRISRSAVWFKHAGARCPATTCRLGHWYVPVCTMYVLGMDQHHGSMYQAHTSMYLYIDTFHRYLGHFGDHIVPAVLYHYHTQVMLCPDLINS